MDADKVSMRVGILHPQSFYRLPEGKTWSGRIRARWLWENWPEAEPYRQGAVYDAILFSPQCAAPCASAAGRPLRILDVYNPDWQEPGLFQKAVRLCHAVTCSSPQIAAHVRTLTGRPVECIPDRLDLSKYPDRKTHAGLAQSVAWYGYSTSQQTLVHMVPEVLRRAMKLMVISDALRRDLFGELADAIHFVPYHHASFERDLLDCADIVLNPRLEYGRFQYKSNNRSLTAWALGIPVAASAPDLDRFHSREAREQEAALRLEEIKEHWDIRISIEAHRKLLSRLTTRCEEAALTP